jgi:peptidoglycan/LPS O-acetylase OafA/YrhL
VAVARRDDFRADIDRLRGIAVVMVVTFHATLLSGAAATLSGGFIGVDRYFVVSGFLITGLLMRERERTGRISFTGFYARRVRRMPRPPSWSC